MRIAEFKITKYGPLREIGPFELGAFNLFWGKNETGKTLTIDALVKMLLGKGLKEFENIERVGEAPEGYLVFERQKGEKTKMPEGGSLPDISHLTGSDCRNIFIIRDSDVAIPKEAQFYINITDRLTGLKTEQINRLEDVLIEKAKITPTDHRFRNQKGENLGQRLEKAQELLCEIEKIEQAVMEQGLETAEKDLAKSQEQLEEAKARLESLELAQKRERFEKASAALEGLSQMINKLQRLGKYNEADYQKWRDLDRDITGFQREKLDLLWQLKQEEHSLNALVQKDIPPHPQEQAKAWGLQRNVVIFGVLTALSLAGLVISSVMYLLAPVAIFGLACLYFAIIQAQVSKDRKKQLEKRINQLQERIQGLKEQIQEREARAEKAKSDIEELREMTGLSLLEKYKENLSSKARLQRRIDKKTAVLSHIFGGSDQPEGNIQVWQRQVEFLQKYRDKARSVKFSEAELEEVDKQRVDLEAKIQALEQDLVSFQERLADIGAKANNILNLDERLLCETSVDLKEGIKKRIKEFIDSNNCRRRNVLKALRILKEISDQEKAKVAQLFGKDSLVSDYFSKITNHRYQQALFNQDKALVQVETSAGEVLSVDKLSGGAFDQLYMCVRLALGKKLLEGEKGFFILDDPFVKADPDRLKHLLSILKRVAELGWQIIYFSSKGEIKEGLDKDIKQGSIRQFSLK